MLGHCNTSATNYELVVSKLLFLWKRERPPASLIMLCAVRGGCLNKQTPGQGQIEGGGGERRLSTQLVSECARPGLHRKADSSFNSCNQIK